MDIKKVGKIPASRVSTGACLLGTSTILLCYSLAVGLGHVPAWFPMISDCAVYAPEKYPFRIGMILSSVLVFVNALLFYFYIDSRITRNVVDKISIILAGIACIGLAILAAVNEQEDNSVHSTAAVVFFFGYEAFMIISSIRLAFVPSYSKVSVYIKRFIALVAGILLGLFVHFSAHWGKYHIEIALIEWSAVLLILLYNGSMVFEFQAEYVAELLFAAPSSPKTSSSILTSPDSETVIPLSSFSSPSVYSYPSNNGFVPYYLPNNQMYFPVPMVAEYRE